MEKDTCTDGYAQRLQCSGGLYSEHSGDWLLSSFALLEEPGEKVTRKVSKRSKMGAAQNEIIHIW